MWLFLWKLNCCDLVSSPTTHLNTLFELVEVDLQVMDHFAKVIEIFEV